MAKWNETSVIHEKSSAPDSIKEKIRCGAKAENGGVTIAILWNQRCHNEYPTQARVGMQEIPPKQARELAQAILKAADEAEGKS